MRRSGENGPEPAGPLSARPPLTLAEVARLGLFASIVAGFLFSAAMAFHVGWEPAVVCMLATSALAAASLPLVLRGAGELHEPIWLVLLSVGIGTTAKAFYVVLGPRARVDFLLLGKEPADLMFAALVIAVGLSVFSLGYLSGNFRWRLRSLEKLSSRNWPLRTFAGVVGILVVVGMLSILAFAVRQNLSFTSLADLSSKRFGADSNITSRGGAYGYLRWGATLVELAFYLALARWAASRARLWSLAGGLVCALGLMAAVFPIFVSSRQTLMFMLLRMVLIWLCIRGQPRPRHAAVVLVVALAILGSMLALRRNQSDWEGIRKHVTVSSLLEITVGGRHLLDLTKTAHILSGVPGTIGFKYGRTLVDWVAAPIPRSLWRNKPAVAPGPELGPALMQTTAATGVPPAIVGELFLNFGLPGVMIGLLAVGVLLRSMYATLVPFFPSEGIVLIFAVLTSRLAFDLIGNSVGNAITKLLMEIIPLTLAIWACSRPRRAA